VTAVTSSSSAPRISVVVASYKRPDALETVLTSLARQTLPTAEFELAVVVDGIDELEGRYRDVLESARREYPFALRYEFQENAGQSVARNRAIVGASSPWICVVDDDMELLPEFLEGHLELLEAGGPSTVVIGRVIPEDDWERSPLYEAVRTSHMLEWHESMGTGAKQPTGYTLVTQNVSFGRAFYLEVGGFDPKLRLGEDSELGLRFEFAGGRFVFGSKAAAVHRSRVGSYGAWLRRQFEYGRMGVYIYEKLGRDPRAHPLRNLVNGSKMNAAAVHALCWSNPVADTGIAALRVTGNALQRIGLMDPAIATHKAILAIAFHVGVKNALGSWRELLAAKRRLAETDAAPREAT
jgi:glycosyltransferase involved in cell wall biosynthesis